MGRGAPEVDEPRVPLGAARMSHAPKSKTPTPPRRTEFRRRLTIGLLTAAFVSIVLTGGGYLVLDLFEFRSSVLRRLEGNAAWVARNHQAFRHDPALAAEQAAMAESASPPRTLPTKA